MLVLLIDHLQKTFEREEKGGGKKQFRAYKYRKLQNLTHQGELKGKKGGPSLKWFIETTWFFFFLLKALFSAWVEQNNVRLPLVLLLPFVFEIPIFCSIDFSYWFILSQFLEHKRDSLRSRDFFYGGMNQ